MKILVLNAGSSSLKFRLYDVNRLRPLHEPETVLVSGMLDRIGTPTAKLQFRLADRATVKQPIAASSITHAAEQVVSTIMAGVGTHIESIDAVGHRIVHGGARFYKPTRIDRRVTEEIRDLFELAPLHNPPGLSGIEACSRLLPEAPAVAVFDTAFHHDLPKEAARYALPPDMNAPFQVRRYGFHGISYAYVSARLLTCLEPDAAGTRAVLCHLGNGASVCAVRDGRSMDTSMGFTPLEGLVMGTRSGDVDPGLLLYLIRARGFDAERLEDMLNHQSGLLGLSGRSGDVRDLEQFAMGGDALALSALDAFAYRVRKYIGAYAAALGGLDALAFTGGIGEHSADMRTRICQGLEFLGVKLDSERNREASADIPQLLSETHPITPVWVVPTDEERQIARETYMLLQNPT